MFPINEILGKNPQTEPDMFLHAHWQAPDHVKTLMTMRHGGVSRAPYNSLNLGSHVGDHPEHVKQNRALVQMQIGLPVCYLQQTHSTIIVDASEALGKNIEADACVDRTGKVVCGIMTADCLPVLFADREGTVVAAAHAGWRGLAAGILPKTIECMNVAPENIIAFLGPAIGPDAFEVGKDVFDAFCNQNADAVPHFHPINEHQYLADIYALARQQLTKLGVQHISGGTHCTVLEREHFFSYRRDGETGRMLSAIWLTDK